MKHPIPIIDCAIKDPAFDIFNKTVELFKHPFTYHRPPLNGIEDIKEVQDPLAYIVLGSNSSANDELPWQTELAAMLKEQCQKGYPVLGLCFGHQLMAKAYGATIGRCSESEQQKNSHLGTRKIKMMANFERIQKDQELEYVVVHGEEIKTLPEGLDLIAQSPEVQFEGISHKELPFIGFQGHPEATKVFVKQEIGQSEEASKYERAFEDGHFIISNFIDFAKRTRNLEPLI
ncbi:MAG: type 1 glutamine amidotransferase [Bacteriovoracaceae bacterium]